MTFIQRYYDSKIWWERIMVMEIYHLTLITNYPKWTLAMTARDFDCSISLVSENLKIAENIVISPDLIKCKSRAEALKIVNKE